VLCIQPVRHILSPINCYPWFGLIVSIKLKDEFIDIFLGLLRDQLRAFHVVVILHHILLDDQVSLVLADLVFAVAGALTPTLGDFEACGHEKAFQFREYLKIKFTFYFLSFFAFLHLG